MKKLFTSLLIATVSLLAFAQEDISLVLKSKYEAQEYSDIISEHGSKIYAYPAKAIYYVGMAYNMSGDDLNCLRCMILSISKDPNDPEPHYTKGMTFNYLEQYASAIPDFENAIQLDNSNSKYYSGLGDAYFELDQYEKALQAYREATTKDNPIDWPFKKLPEVCAALNQPDKALEASYAAKSKISKDGVSYQNMLFNIGMYENLNGNFLKAETALLELIQLNPEDYHAISKIIQTYYGMKDYDKAQPYRKILYTAKNKNLLNEDLSTMFCFDQFAWKGQQIMAFERYEEGSKDLYYKHIFYVMKANGEIDYQIQTEYSPVSVEMGGPKYLLGMDKDSAHFTFKAGFNDGFLYDDLKKAVIKAVEEKMEEGASSRMGN